jgi:c(7)-type cytochrome triheme protein
MIPSGGACPPAAATGPPPGPPLRAAVATALVALALFTGCSPETRQRLLPVFFDGVPEEGRSAPPPTRRVRQDLQRENEALRREVADLKAMLQARTEAAGRSEAVRPAERAGTFEEVRSLLPGDPSGQVDWMQALRAGAIRPRPGPGREATAQGVFDLDVRLARGGHPFFAARFPHASHTAWLACDTCHPALFPIASGTPRPVITMAAIRAGEACGTCHGRVAFSIAGDCVRCHPGVPATTDWQRPEPQSPLERARTWAEAVKLLPAAEGHPDWEAARTEGLLKLRAGADPGAKLEEPTDLDVERVPKNGVQALKVVFRHASHTAWLTCDSCHPQPFEQEAGATPITMTAIVRGELCGACHDKVAFPADACLRCHTQLRDGQ